jgi:ADP-heptose:LPS heptosyltransferase
MTKIKIDCRHMRWDRPCTPHKREGVHCDGCPYYNPVREQVLIIKLDARGDVLRTTCILPALREKYSEARVTWVTMPESMPLLENNPYVDRAVAYGPDALAMLWVERFDLVLSLDSAVRGAALASMAKAREKKGFGLGPSGSVFPFDNEAVEWFMMGLFDDVKKKNERTYQDIIMDVCGLSGMRQEIVIRLTDGEREFARRFAQSVGMPSEEEKAKRGIGVVGINTGAGSRWPMKQWPVERCVELVRRLARNDSLRLVLFGGDEEVERNRMIKRIAGKGLIDTGCHNSLRQFMALVNLCDVLVTADSLGLHVALGLGKKVVALFGPTSAAEIDVYGRGIKIVPDSECACCYLRQCDREPSCMDEIDVESVFDAVTKLIGD